MNNGFPNSHEAAWGTKIKLEYDGSNNLIYKGAVPMGTPEDETGWLLQKYIYTGTNLTEILSSIGSWDDRAGVTYS